MFKTTIRAGDGGVRTPLPLPHPWSLTHILYAFRLSEPSSRPCWSHASGFSPQEAHLYRFAYVMGLAPLLLFRSLSSCRKVASGRWQARNRRCGFKGSIVLNSIIPPQRIVRSLAIVPPGSRIGPRNRASGTVLCKPMFQFVLLFLSLLPPALLP